MKIQNQGFDHVEFSVEKISKHAQMYLKMGFEKIGERILPNKGTLSEVYAQGFIRIMLTEFDEKNPSVKNQDSYQFKKTHGDGICVLAVDVDDATKAFEETVAKGARPAMKPTRFESSFGTVVRSEIWTPGDIRYAFIERPGFKGHQSKGLFDEELVVDRFESPSPKKLRVIDHLTNNVDMGQMPVWVDWYKKVFDFKVTRHFDISTGRTGLTSDVVQSENLKITVPVNQANEPQSQVQEFVNRFHGAGVQHLAFLTTDIISTVTDLKAIEVVPFLVTPKTYYEAVPSRMKKHNEDLSVLEKHSILIDGEGEGYLLQIFTGEIVGPFFFEFIERKGNKGFGEGNFKALFEAIELDQIKRGTLKA